MISRVLKFFSFVFFLNLFLNNTFVLADGFDGGTLVWVPQNEFKPIAYLKIGDPIISVDMSSKKIIIDRVKKIEKARNKELMIMYMESDDIPGIDYIMMAPEQQLLCPDAKGWVKAKHLRKGNHLVSCLGKRKVAGYAINEDDHEQIVTYRITLEKHPHFFISKRKFLVHNFFPMLTLAFEYGTGKAVMCSIANQIGQWLIRAAISYGIIKFSHLASEQVMGLDVPRIVDGITDYALRNDVGSGDSNVPGVREYESYLEMRQYLASNGQRSHSVSRTNSSHSQRGSVGGPRRPDDNNDRDKSKNKLIYEEAGYHSERGNGIKSKRPDNGQSSLDRSVKVKDKHNGEQRIAIQKKDEFVVLDRHLPNKYHGHVRSWNELSSAQKLALQNNSLTDFRGKILK